MRKFTIYGNCQGPALAKTLLEYADFKENFDYAPLKSIQTLELTDIENVIETIQKCDLIIYQPISTNYRIRELSTARILLHTNKNSILVSLPSLYFNGYFPHIDTLDGRLSILNFVHDYIMIYGYLLGLEQHEIIELIKSEDFYDEELSNRLLKKSISDLKKREVKNGVDIRVSDYIADNYRSQKLYNHFNHPKRPVYEFIASKILDMLGMSNSKHLILDETEKYYGEISTPIYRSTYTNLRLMFSENFLTYGSANGIIGLPEVVSNFYSTYETIDKNYLMKKVVGRKPFIIKRFNEIMPKRAPRHYVLSLTEKYKPKLNLSTLKQRLTNLTP